MRKLELLCALHLPKPQMPTSVHVLHTRKEVKARAECNSDCARACVRHALMLSSVVLEDAMYITIQVYAYVAVKDTVYARTRNTGCDC